MLSVDELRALASICIVFETDVGATVVIVSSACRPPSQLMIFTSKSGLEQLGVVGVRGSHDSSMHTTLDLTLLLVLKSNSKEKGEPNLAERSTTGFLALEESCLYNEKLVVMVGKALSI